MTKKKKWKPDIFGWYRWRCPYHGCDKVFEKTTPQGIGMAKENHMRSHRDKR